MRVPRSAQSCTALILKVIAIGTGFRFLLPVVLLTATNAMAHVTHCPAACAPLELPYITVLSSSPQEVSARAYLSALSGGNITINNPVGCPTATRFCDVFGSCTSVVGLSSSCINSLVRFQAEYAGPIEITGGSECGHSEGVNGGGGCLHSLGCKVDLGGNGLAVLTTYIKSVFPTLKNGVGCSNPVGPNFGTPLSSGGPCFTFEGNHVDIGFPTDSATNLTVSVTGSGNGSVTSSASLVGVPGYAPSYPPINCGQSASNCTATLTRGITISLDATPDPQSVFVGWTNAVPNFTSTAAVSLDQSKTVTAQFDQQPPPPPGQGLCWTWISTLPGYAWNGTCGNTPSMPTRPPQGCWHWDPTANPFHQPLPSQSIGAWIFDPICGGNPNNRLSLTSLYGGVLSSHDPNDRQAP